MWPTTLHAVTWPLIMCPDPNYVHVCRVALGHHVRTHANGRGATSVDEPGQRIFPVSFRELAAVPGITPPVH